MINDAMMQCSLVLYPKIMSRPRYVKLYFRSISWGQHKNTLFECAKSVSFKFVLFWQFCFLADLLVASVRSISGHSNHKGLCRAGRTSRALSRAYAESAGPIRGTSTRITDEFGALRHAMSEWHA